jgi:hypothetical protein
MGKVHDEPGQRWHLPALPTTLARQFLPVLTTLLRINLINISPTPHARQFLPVLTTLLRS